MDVNNNNSFYLPSLASCSTNSNFTKNRQMFKSCGDCSVNKSDCIILNHKNCKIGVFPNIKTKRQTNMCNQTISGYLNQTIHEKSTQLKLCSEMPHLLKKNVIE